MFQIDTSTAVSTPPALETPGTPGYFGSGTRVSTDWFNTVQDEISNVVTGAGETLDTTHSINNQLLTAINALISNAVKSAVPSGCIIIWSGTVSNVPSGYAVCDGSNGTPDLRDKFVIGQGPNHAANTTGGNANNEITLSVGQLPSHAHAINDPGHAHGVYDPGHGHGVNDPGHSHTYQNQINPGAGNTAPYPGAPSTGNTSTSTTGISIDNSGTGISIDGATTGITVGATGSGEAIDITPEYFAVVYIMKL